MTYADVSQQVGGVSLPLEEMWHTEINKQEWRSLAVVSLRYSESVGHFLRGMALLASEQPKEKVCLLVASEGMLPVVHHSMPYEVVYASALAPTDASLCLKEIPSVSFDMKHGLSAYTKKIFFMDVLHQRPSLMPLLKHVDAVLVVVHLEQDSLKDVDRVMRMLDTQRVLGVVTCSQIPTQPHCKAEA
jgi:hypothetical protein